MVKDASNLLFHTPLLQEDTKKQRNEIVYNYAVFSPKGSTMAAPHPLVLLRHTFILNFMLKNTVDQTSCITDALIPPPFILHPGGNTDY